MSLNEKLHGLSFLRISHKSAMDPIFERSFKMSVLDEATLSRNKVWKDYFDNMFFFFLVELEGYLEFKVIVPQHKT